MADSKKAAAAVPARGTSSGYRDDPDAVSMHTTRSDYEYDDVPQLPSYSDSVTTDENGVPNTNEAPPPADEYAIHTAPRSHFQGGDPRKTIGNETTYRMEERLMDTESLHGYIQDYLSHIPPQPYVRIQGWHWETVQKEKNKKETNKVYDFDVKLRLQHYLPRSNQKGFWGPYTVHNGTKVHRGSWRKIRAPGSSQDIEVNDTPTPGLKEWVQDFCDNKASLKVFRVSRSVIDLNTEYLKESLVSLVRSTHYRGHVEISFPIADKNVDIFSPHWINRARTTWIRWIFYLTFLWIFTWPILFFMTKRWDVYRVNWRFSRCVADHANQRNVRKYATISEHTWFKRHENLIKSLVLDKFQGDATEMSLDVDVDAAMRRASGSPVQTGNRNVDAAVSFVHGGLTAWNTLNGRQAGGGWGMDSDC